MNIPDIDFKLLVIFQALMSHRSVSNVATELEMSQPAVSRGLGRLREHFRDRLFVRTGQSMQPTPCAHELSPVVDELLDLYYSQLSQRREFVPRRSKRTFKVAASEIGQVLLFPRLTERFVSEAPGLSVKAIPLGAHSLIHNLETGSADVAVGSFPKLYAGVYERTLFKETYVSIVRTDHPTIGSRLSSGTFKKNPHVLVSAEGLGHIHEQIEKQIVDACPSENVQMISQTFLVGVLLACESDCIVTVPSRVAEVLDQHRNIRKLKPPLELPSFDVKLYWHERFHREPSNRWLRNSIVDCLA